MAIRFFQAIFRAIMLRSGHGMVACRSGHVSMMPISRHSSRIDAMAATLTIRDETAGGELPREWLLSVLTERLTVRELIRSRVYQEVQDYNLKRGQIFQGLVQPDETEKTLNGWKLKKPRSLDWKRQFELAQSAFERNQILILINDRQADSLDQEFTIEPKTTVTFLRLTMLVGG